MSGVNTVKNRQHGRVLTENSTAQSLIICPSINITSKLISFVPPKIHSLLVEGPFQETSTRKRRSTAKNSTRPATRTTKISLEKRATTILTRRIPKKTNLHQANKRVEAPSKTGTRPFATRYPKKKELRRPIRSGAKVR